MAFLHSLGIAHRDLKPSNTLIRNKTGDPQIAIVDYDLAKVDYSDVWQVSALPFCPLRLLWHAAHGSLTLRLPIIERIKQSQRVSSALCCL